VLLAARPLADSESAARLFVALAERALDHGEVEHARLGYHMAAWIRWTQGQSSAALEQQLQAMRAVRGGAGDEHIVGMAEAAKCLVLIERDIAQADAMLMEAAALAHRRGFAHQAIAAGLGMLRFHEGRLDDAQGLLHEARLLCKAAGDRVNEFQANEYLVMLDIQRGRFAQALAGCDELMALGDKLRGGSEEPFSRAMAGLCAHAIGDSADAMDQALLDLRNADAKHRLAYVLTHAALLDWQHGRAEAAQARAREALSYAQLLERPTESLLASTVLSLHARQSGDHTAAAHQLTAVQRQGGDSPAAWATRLSQQLMGAGASAADEETR
jgi:tetratricopeptide (TPR) repeat protein